MALPTPIGQFGNTNNDLGRYLNTSFFSNLSLTSETFAFLVSNIIGVLTVAGGLWFLVQIFSGVLQWLSSGGEKTALQNAQKRISNSVIGLLILVLAYALISVIGYFLGFNVLNFADIFKNLIP